jgi:hypothetical protein
VGGGEHREEGAGGGMRSGMCACEGGGGQEDEGVGGCLSGPTLLTIPCDLFCCCCCCCCCCCRL